MINLLSAHFLTADLLVTSSLMVCLVSADARVYRKACDEELSIFLYMYFMCVYISLTHRLNLEKSAVLFLQSNIYKAVSGEVKDMNGFVGPALGHFLKRAQQSDVNFIMKYTKFNKYQSRIIKKQNSSSAILASVELHEDLQYVPSLIRAEWRDECSLSD